MQPTSYHNRQLLTDDQHAIVALCSPRGSGALAIIRISGVDAVAVADVIAKLSSGTSLTKSPTHTIHHGNVVDGDGVVVDEVLFFLMRSPKTFTGQDTVEITSHNNQFIIERIINAALAAGARAARPGEFSKRAFLNGKIDLLQAESINDLIHAQTETALRRSMEQLSGSLSQHLAAIEADLVSLLGHVEASFEFLDEEQRDMDFDAVIKAKTEALCGAVADLQKQFSLQQQVKEGVRIAIVGVVNAGKSTLFNALINKERAIVTDQEGTTRDSIETGLYRNGMFWLLIDTAGLRQTADVIEQKGIERSFVEADAADVVLVVVDATRPLTPQVAEQYEELMRRYGHKCIVVVNKIDQAAPGADRSWFDTRHEVTHSPRTGSIDLGTIIRQGSVEQSPVMNDGENGCAVREKSFVVSDREAVVSNHKTEVISVSAQTREGIASLEAAVLAKVQQLFAQSNAPFLLNQRHVKLLTEIGQQLKFIANSYSGGIDYVLIACHLKELLEKVSELTGKNVSERVLDTVFNEFCVGK